MDSLAARALSQTHASARTRAHTHTRTRTHSYLAVPATAGGDQRWGSSVPLSDSTLREKAAWVLLHTGHDLELAASRLPQSLSPGTAKTFRAAVITE